MDAGRFEELAGMFESDEGMTRFAAETRAAERLGVKRWEAMDAIKRRDSGAAPHHGEAARGDAADDLSRVQPRQEEEARPVPQRDVQVGRGGVAMLALRA